MITYTIERTDTIIESKDIHQDKLQYLHKKKSII